MSTVNKCIELLAQGQPVFVDHPTLPPALTYESGRSYAATWADMLVIEFEHYSFDTAGLAQFMPGLRDGGPTPSGHSTPTVIATLPHGALSSEEVRYNAWQARHALATGVHGILLTHARDPEAVKCFVSSCRYPFHTEGTDVLPEGLRGGGGERLAAEVWGVSTAEYLRRADPWPLNPNGELLLGLKIEDRHGLAKADSIAAVPGVAFAEWGPLDMGMSFGDLDSGDPPYRTALDAARTLIESALDRSGVAFYCGWTDPALSASERLNHLVDKVGAKLIYATQEMAEIGRARRQ